MTYDRVVTAEFIDRPNRFIAHVRLTDGTHETVHVKNTGRCRELLIPGRRVILAEGKNPARKTKYDLIAVDKPGIGLINMDSQAPNAMAEEWLRSLYPNADIRREVTYGASRFDICMEDKGAVTFIEVKGVTLEYDSVAMFPDAPTERGVKHLRELIRCKAEGYGAKLLLVIQIRGVTCFMPNDATHAEFGAVLREAAAAGVEIIAMDSVITEQSAIINKPVTVLL